jgi:hypothetical protein
MPIVAAMVILSGYITAPMILRQCWQLCMGCSTSCNPCSSSISSRWRTVETRLQHSRRKWRTFELSLLLPVLRQRSRRLGAMFATVYHNDRVVAGSGRSCTTDCRHSSTQHCTAQDTACSSCMHMVVDIAVSLHLCRACQHACGYAGTLDNVCLQQHMLSPSKHP